MERETLEAALIGYRCEAVKIQAKIEDIERQLRRGGKRNTLAPTAAERKHRISPEGRERIRQAQLRRWKAAKKQQAAGA